MTACAPASLDAIQPTRGIHAAAGAYLVHCILFCLASPAIYILLADDVPLLWVNPEFVFYRIGDALAIEAHEVEQVHPVQGLPNAIVSKCIVKCLLLAGTNPTTS